MSNESMDYLIENVLAEITSCLHLVPGESLTEAGTMIEAAPKIFLAGAGRSGLIMRALGTRLMHLGKTVYVVGESTTPSIQAGELLILGSGSGQTSTLLAIAQKAKHQGAKILLFTTNPSSPLANMADQSVALPAPSLGDIEEERDLKSMQPMGSLFEQSLLILCDTIILWLMLRTGVSASQMRVRHANLE
jgi:6-phospho-3-hexuloisomerase